MAKSLTANVIPLFSKGAQYEDKLSVIIRPYAQPLYGLSAPFPPSAQIIATITLDIIPRQSLSLDSNIPTYSGLTSMPYVRFTPRKDSTHAIDI
jgi:hypothetical protein